MPKAEVPQADLELLHTHMTSGPNGHRVLRRPARRRQPPRVRGHGLKDPRDRLALLTDNLRFLKDETLDDIHQDRTVPTEVLEVVEPYEPRCEC